MIVAYCIAFISFMAWLARMSGGGAGSVWLVYHAGTKLGAFWAQQAARLPEILFGLCFGVANYLIFGDIAWAALAWGWSFIWMETGHGNYYHDGMLPTQYPDTPGTLERYSGLHWLLPRIGYPSRGKVYCRALMGLKWFLIGLPILSAAPMLAVLGPLAYAISFRVFRVDSEPAEWLSGFFAGWSIIAALVIFRVVY